jgi:hypothetical protein
VADSQWLVASRISKKGATESRLFRCINSSGYIADLWAHARYALCRPYGTYIFRAAYPGLTPWANIFRRFGAGSGGVSGRAQHFRSFGSRDRNGCHNSLESGHGDYSFCNEVCVLCSRVNNTEVKTCDREIENWGPGTEN